MVPPAAPFGADCRPRSGQVVFRKQLLCTQRRGGGLDTLGRHGRTTVETPLYIVGWIVIVTVLTRLSRK